MITISNGESQDKSIVSLWCDRSSPLSNPYRIGEIYSRDVACDKYQIVFGAWIANPSWAKEQHAMLEDIIALHKGGMHVELCCHCVPKRCHCETIKNYCLDKALRLS